MAAAILRSLEKGRNEVNLTFRGKMLVLTTRFAPWIVDFFARRKVRSLFADEIAERKRKREAVSV